MQNDKGKDANSGGENSPGFICRITDSEVTANSRQNLKTWFSPRMSTVKNAIATLGLVFLMLLVNFQSGKGVCLLRKHYEVNLIEQKVAAAPNVTYK